MKYKTEWDLSHIYKGEPKKLVAKDLAETKRSYLSFAKKYRKDKKHLKSPAALVKAIEEYEQLAANPMGSRPSYYFSYRKCLNAEDAKAEAELAKLSDF